jgi:hypothetical protein
VTRAAGGASTFKPGRALSGDRKTIAARIRRALGAHLRDLAQKLHLKPEQIRAGDPTFVRDDPRGRARPVERHEHIATGQLQAALPNLAIDVKLEADAAAGALQQLERRVSERDQQIERLDPSQ